LTARIWPRSSSVAALQPGARAAGVAGDRLGVEAAIVRGRVFAGAGGAQGEPAHRGGGPVVGNAGDDGQPRPAVGAVGERVAVAPLERVQHLGAAARAGGGVRHHAGARRRGHAVGDVDAASAGESALAARSMRSMRASGGACAGRLAMNRSIVAAGPRSRMLTPSPSLANRTVANRTVADVEHARSARVSPGTAS